MTSSAKKLALYTANLPAPPSSGDQEVDFLSANEPCA